MIDGSFDRSRREERRPARIERRPAKAAKRARQQSRTRPRHSTNFAVVLAAVHNSNACACSWRAQQHARADARHALDEHTREAVCHALDGRRRIGATMNRGRGLRARGPADNIIDETDAHTSGWSFRWTRQRSMRALRQQACAICTSSRFARFPELLRAEVVLVL